MLRPGRLRVAPSPAPEVVLPPTAWPVAADASSPSWPVADDVRSISVLDLLEGLTMSELERAPGPELEPPRAEEKAELAGRMFRQQFPLAGYSDA